MGDYTEVYVSGRMIQDLPKDVEQILTFMFGSDNRRTFNVKTPTHTFFTCQRWKMVGRCNSYSFVPLSVGEFQFDSIGDNWNLTSRSDLKNYDQEIQKFFDWINPYMDAGVGEMIGYLRDAQSARPTVALKGETSPEFIRYG